jgi:repressor LexA
VSFVTPKQRAYLDYIRDYVALHRQPPAEADFLAFFRASPSAVHQMIVTLAKKGLITREPRRPRSVRLIDQEPEEADDDLPSRPPDDITDPLDREIEPLVLALRADGSVLTKSSCCGHGKKPAFVDLAVEGMDGLRLFVGRLNLIDSGVRSQALLDVTLNWSVETVTSCAFDIFPNWIMLSLTIEGNGRNGAPSGKLLSKIARVWTTSVTRTPRLPEREVAKR